MLKTPNSVFWRKLSAILILGLFFSCTTDNPEPTGLFDAEFSGDFSESLEGTARFVLQPTGTNGVILVQLRTSDNRMIRLTFPNPNSSQIQLEPGTYTIVPQLNQDIFSEVLVDYIDDNLSFTAASGEVRVGISKPTQISGRIVDAEFILLRSMCNGTFDAIP